MPTLPRAPHACDTKCRTQRPAARLRARPRPDAPWRPRPRPRTVAQPRRQGRPGPAQPTAPSTCRNRARRRDRDAPAQAEDRPTPGAALPRVDPGALHDAPRPGNTARPPCPAPCTARAQASPHTTVPPRVNGHSFRPFLPSITSMNAIHVMVLEDAAAPSHLPSPSPIKWTLSPLPLPDRAPPFSLPQPDSLLHPELSLSLSRALPILELVVDQTDRHRRRWSPWRRARVCTSPSTDDRVRSPARRRRA
jgi:hypothetical protein